MAFFRAHSLSSGPFDADVLIVPLTGPTARIPRALARISPSSAERAQRALELNDFEPKSGSRFLLHPDSERALPACSVGRTWATARRFPRPPFEKR